MTKQLATPAAIDAETVNAALGSAIQAAQLEDAKIAVCILDAGGNLAGFQRMPGSFLASTDYAQWKAWTSISFGISTDEFGELLDGLPVTIGEGLLGHPRATRLPGGFPIHRDGQLVGGIGVSGGTGEQDVAIAQAGLEVLRSGDG